MQKSPPDVVCVRPGQLWSWGLIDDGVKDWTPDSWLVQRVTTENRHDSFSIGSYDMIYRGETFVVLSTGDPGPKSFDFPGFDNFGQLIVEPVKRWHLVLHKGLITYFEDAWLSSCELLLDEGYDLSAP